AQKRWLLVVIFLTLFRILQTRLQAFIQGATLRYFYFTPTTPKKTTYSVIPLLHFSKNRFY
ncbi:MAG: hypothetical protein J6K86_05440, partial [Clostridia bacterium]|nr:hypothetical protein [Clostridia bacterium]